MAEQLCWVELPEADQRYLQSCARIRQISTTRLTCRLIRMIARDQLVLAILDDESRPAEPQAEGEPSKSRYHRSKLFQDCH